jgi:release factor glutamine methyltransferase
VTTYGAALAAGRKALESGGVESATLDARLLLAAAAGLDMAALIARDRDPLPSLAAAAFDAQLKRRLMGEPVARILGEKEFWGLPFLVNEATLVPRPETETLVEAVLAEAKRRAFAQQLRICDLGTGSGAIVIALLTELPQARGVATDISKPALEIAGRNAERMGVGARITFRQADFAEGPDGPFDVIVANPPYISSNAIAGLPAEVRSYDPVLALDGGSDGFSAYRAILARAPASLAKAGFLALEIGHDQSAEIAEMCKAAGLGDVAFRCDLGGVKRVVIASVIMTPSRPGPSKKHLEKSG